MKYLRLALLILVLVLSLSYLKFHAVKDQSVQSSPAAFKDSMSVNKADSLWVVVNKGRVLPADYVPAPLVEPKVAIRNGLPDERLLRADAASALEKMFAGANSAGLKLMLASGYRSYATQQQLYSSYAKSSGSFEADKYSAHPGYSEHQTGLAADVEPASRTCEVLDCFAGTPEGQWLAANSYKYGFIVRYTKDNQALTGYSYEPWHVRYVGEPLALKLSEANQTLEQFFNLPIYSDYSANAYTLLK